VPGRRAVVRAVRSTSSTSVKICEGRSRDDGPIAWHGLRSFRGTGPRDRADREGYDAPPGGLHDRACSSVRRWCGGQRRTRPVADDPLSSRASHPAEGGPAGRRGGIPLIGCPQDHGGYRTGARKSQEGWGEGPPGPGGNTPKGGGPARSGGRGTPAAGGRIGALGVSGFVHSADIVPITLL